MSNYGEPSPRISALITDLAHDIDKIAPRLAEHITANVEFYRATGAVSREELVEACHAQLSAVLGRFGSAAHFDTSFARASGHRRAAAGVPLSPIMDAYRVGSAFIWELIADEIATAGIPADDLIAVTAQLWQAQDVFTEAMSEGYRAEATSRLLTQETERAAMVEALLRGQVMANATVWELADLLHLPRQGPFVVVVAELAHVGRHALSTIENRLDTVDVRSAWRLLPDLQVGIVAVPSERHRTRLLEVLHRDATVRQGLSPPYPELPDTGAALRLARVAMTGSPRDGGVTVFDEAPLSVTAVAEPDVMRRVAETVLGPLDSMRPDDRAILLDTLEAWLDAGGSADAAGTALFCHPNTVRQRLRRIEERTARSLSDPRQLTELCIALEARRRLTNPA